jgi:hypothetical protein
MLKTLGIVVSLAIIGLAAFLAHTPWRAHGGRFVTEYLVLAGPIALVGLIVLAVTLKWGG